MQVSELFSDTKVQAKINYYEQYASLFGLEIWSFSDTLENDIGVPGKMYDGAIIKITKVNKYDINIDIKLKLRDRTFTTVYLYCPAQSRRLSITATRINIINCFVKSNGNDMYNSHKIFLGNGFYIKDLYCNPSTVPQTGRIDNLHILAGNGKKIIRPTRDLLLHKRVIFDKDINWIVGDAIPITNDLEALKEMLPEDFRYNVYDYKMLFSMRQCIISISGGYAEMKFLKGDLTKDINRLKKFMQIYLKNYAEFNNMVIPEIIFEIS